MALTSPGFQIAQRFFTKELSFCINMSDLPVIRSSARTYIFVDALSAALGKMTTCLFFFSGAGAFSPHFVEAGVGGWEGGGITSIPLLISCPSSDV